MNTMQLIPYYIFQKVLATEYYNIESLGNFYEVYFRIPNFYKDIEYLRVKFSPDHNVLFEFLNKYYHRWRARRAPIRDIFFDIKAQIVQYIKQNHIMSTELLNLLISWFFLRFTLKFFNFSGRCWYNLEDCEKFGNPKNKFTFWELMTEPQNSVSKYWYIKLFEKVYQHLKIWMSFISEDCTFKINLKNEGKKDIFDSFHKSAINIGIPLLITQKALVVIRNFDYSEVKDMSFIIDRPFWLEEIKKILKKYGYDDYRSSYSTFRKYRNKVSKYPRFHGLVFLRR